MKIELTTFPPLPEIPNVSPFCMKLETYLRMSGREYSVKHVRSSRKSPTGKIPYVTIDGAVLTDSGQILDTLESQLAEPVDHDLTAVQKAEALARRRRW